MFMKKLLYVAVITCAAVTFISCGKSDECKCDSGLTYTEEDAKDAGVTLETVCATAKVGDESCAIQ